MPVNSVIPTLSPPPTLHVFRSLSGNEKAGEVNGEYEVVPYKTINKTVTVSYFRFENFINAVGYLLERQL